MAVTIENSGTQTATLAAGTEHTLHTDADAKVFVLLVDTKNMADGDEVILRAKMKVLTGSTLAVVYFATYAHVQTDIVKASIPVPSPGFQMDYTLQQIAGTFAIDTIVGTISSGDAVTGQTSGAKGIVFPLGGGNVSGTSVVIRWVSGTFNGAETVEKDGATSNTFNTTAVTGRPFEWSVVSIG